MHPNALARALFVDKRQRQQAQYALGQIGELYAATERYFAARYGTRSQIQSVETEPRTYVNVDGEKSY